jgi:hypothetical protein
MLDVDFSTGKFKCMEIPLDRDENTHAVFSLDENGDIIIVARTTNLALAEEYIRENVDTRSA